MEECLYCGKTVEFIKEGNDLLCPHCGWEVQAARNFNRRYPKDSKRRKRITATIKKHLMLQETGFIYKQQFYTYTDIGYIYFEPGRKATFLSNDHPRSTIFTIYIKSGEQLTINKKQLSDYVKPNRIDQSENNDYLLALYKSLLKKTFTQRKQKYINEIEEKGNLKIDDISFHKDNILKYKEKEYKMNECQIKFTNKLLEIVVPENGILKKRRISASVGNDSDVILDLLRQLYHIPYLHAENT